MGRRKFVAILAVAAVFVLLGVAPGGAFFWFQAFGRGGACGDGAAGRGGYVAGGGPGYAGHRDLYDCCFYHIDKLQKGDKIYLDYKGYRYTYDYYSTKIVASNDWSVISRQGFSCITLTSCYPLGTSEKRIIVVGILSDIAEHQVS
jgi:hypothetical protein